MAKLLKLRRGTTSQHNTFTGAEGEVTIDTTKDTAVVHDGSTTGGRPLAREDMSNVSSSAIAGRLGADAIATTKIAGGALPTDVTVASANIVNGTIVNADLANDCVNGNKIADNSINSEHYVDGSIDRVHLAADIVDGSKIANDSINSEHYVDGSIDTAHIANDQVTFGKMQNVASQTIFGRAGGGTGDATALSASDVRGIINVENGATADQTAAEILAAVKTVDGSGSGLDADTLDGAQPSVTAGNDTIVKRHSSGYVFANYFNTTANNVSSGVTKVMVETGNDNYIRHGDAGSIRTFINVENGATADQTAAEIRTLVESASDSNVFTDADHSKLNGIESGATADQTASEINALLSNQNLSVDRLDVNGSHGIDNAGWFRNDASGEGVYNTATGQHFYSDNDDYWNVAGGSSANGIRFRDEHGGTIRGYVYAENDNEIGFLNSSGSWSLRCDNSGNVTATGNVTAYSDARLKTNVNTINDALSIVGKLRGVSFDWKESGEHSIGVIAQEVEAVLPELVVTQDVSTTENPEPKEVKSVDYGKIVGVLINAINELKAEVDELKGGK